MPTSSQFVQSAKSADAPPCRHAEADIVVRETYFRKRVPLPWAARLDDAKSLCRLWGSLFGRNKCYVLNDDRLRAIMRRLVTESWSVEQVRWAILAYHARTNDQWHRDRGRPSTTLEDLLDPQHTWTGQRKRRDIFEELVAEGEALRVRSSAPAIAAAPQADTAAIRLYREWQALPEPDRARILTEAYDQCRRRPGFVGWNDERNPQIRHAIVRIMQTGVRRPSDGSHGARSASEGPTVRTRSASEGQGTVTSSNTEASQ